jgi:hypothetical protein
MLNKQNKNFIEKGYQLKHKLKNYIKNVLTKKIQNKKIKRKNEVTRYWAK